MALIDTSGAGSVWLDDKKGIVRAMRLAVCEELAAINTYKGMAEGIARCGFFGTDETGKPLPVPENRLSVEEAKAFSDAILEIAEDELKHVGKLMKLIEILEPDASRILAEGAAEA